MEDAMIINKASFERGFGYGSIYKTEFIDLREKAKAARQTFAFGMIAADPKLQCIGQDGFPFIGTRLEHGDPFYWSALLHWSTFLCDLVAIFSSKGFRFGFFL